MSKYAKGLHGLWVAPLTVCLGLPAYGQAPDEGAVLDEIVVTARKREENLQDVPIAVTAISAETLQREGIKDVQDIAAGDPSLGFDKGIAAYDTRIVIRGLSPTRGRPNVATLYCASECSSGAEHYRNPAGKQGSAFMVVTRVCVSARCGQGVLCKEWFPRVCADNDSSAFWDTFAAAWSNPRRPPRLRLSLHSSCSLRIERSAC